MVQKTIVAVVAIMLLIGAISKLSQLVSNMATADSGVSPIAEHTHGLYERAKRTPPEERTAAQREVIAHYEEFYRYARDEYVSGRPIDPGLVIELRKMEERVACYGLEEELIAPAELGTDDAETTTPAPML